MNSTQTNKKNNDKFIPNKKVTPAMQIAVDQYQAAVSRKLQELKQLLKAVKLES